VSGRHAAPRRPAPRPARPWTPVVVALVGALGLVGGLGTQAYWNDVETVSGATITSGSLDLKVAGEDSYTWSGLSVEDLAPGEAHAAALTLTNAGTTPFTVTATGATNGSLAGYLTFVVTTGGTPSTTTSYPRTGSCSGTQTFSGLIGGGTTVLTASPTVPAGGTLTICVAVTLSIGTPEGEQDKSSQPIFDFTATQVAP
jgi:predicted ribosomally synthesized peptide with SipW-like signal peptide